MPPQAPRPRVPLPGLRVEFADVAFSYEPDRPVLHDVSFVAEPGQTVALVGKSIHRQFGLVTQQNFLFGGTVLDKLRFAGPEATEAEVRAAAPSSSSCSTRAAWSSAARTSPSCRAPATTPASAPSSPPAARRTRSCFSTTTVVRAAGQPPRTAPNTGAPRAQVRFFPSENAEFTSEKSDCFRPARPYAQLRYGNLQT